MDDRYPEYDPKPMQASPRAAWYILALIITVIGPIWSTKNLYDTFHQPFKHKIDINASVQEISINKPGTYTFYERPEFSKDFFNQDPETFFKAEQTPFDFNVRDRQQNTIAVTKTSRQPWLSYTNRQLEFFMGRATIHFEQEGNYLVTIIKPTTSTFLLAQPQPTELYHRVARTIAFLVVTMILGPLLLLVIFFLRQSNIRLQSSPEYQTAGYKRTVNDTRLFAATMHIGGLFGYVFPVGHLLIPMLVYGVLGQEKPLMRANLHSVMNFQISMSIYILLTTGMIFISGAMFSGGALFFIGVLLMLFLLHITLTLLGVIMSFKEGLFFYPLSLPLLKGDQVDDVSDIDQDQ